jgi:hypothetical protein
MTAKPIIDVIADSGKAPALPDGLTPAIKFVNPDYTTRGGFNWFHGVNTWVESDTPFNSATCTTGGLHVACTVAAAQSGGARLSYALWVGVDESEAGPWDAGKRKAPRVFVASPIDLVSIIRSHGREAYLSRAYLSGADLSRADLSGAYGRDDWDALVERGAFR